MKTFFKRSKFFVGLGLAGLISFSSLLAISLPPQLALAKSGCANGQAELPSSADPSTACESIPQNCPGANAASTVQSGNSVSCPYYPVVSSSWTCPIATCYFPGGGVATKGQKAPVFNGYCVPYGPTYSNCGLQTINPNLSPPNTIYCTPTGPTYSNCPAGSVNQYDPATQVVKTRTGVEADNGSNDSTQPATATTSSHDDTVGCAFFLGNPLTWIACPLVGILENFIRFVDNFIMTTLNFNTPVVFNTDASKGDTGFFVAFNSFRVIAIAILVITGLIMVISQALGFEVLDAYTIKKTLPRILVATIFLLLAWPLMRFVVEFFNAAGYGVREIIYSPFSKQVKDTLGNGTLLALNGAIFTALITLGIGGCLSFLLTAALAVLVGFAIIIVRYLALIVLIIFAPVAIVCYVLPNTQKVWNLWRENFIGLLVVFPIISAFIAAGHVFSAVSLVSNSGAGATLESSHALHNLASSHGLANILTNPAQLISGASNTAIQIVGVIAYFLPYFLLPIAFRLATGLIGSIAGFVNDRNRGAFDRLKKYRGNQTAYNAQRLKNGNRFNNSSRFGRALNRTSSGIAAAPKAGLNPMKMRSRYTAAHAGHTFAEAEEVRTKNADFAIGAQDDRLLRAAQHGTSGADIRRRLQSEGITNPAELDNAVGIVERMQNSGSKSAVQQAIAIQRFATGTGFNKERTLADGTKETYFDYDDAFATIRDAAHGDRALAGRLLGTAKGTATQAGQLGFGGASYGALSGELDKKFRNQAVDGDAIALNAFESNDAVTVARARTPHVEAMTRAASKRVAALSSNGPLPRKPGGSVEQGELGRLSAQIDNFKDSAGMYAAPDRQYSILNQGSSSQSQRADIARSYQAYQQQVATARKAGQPDPRPTADILSYMNHRNARGSGDPYDPGRQQDQP